MLVGADADDILQRSHEYLAVADLARLGGIRNGCDDLVLHLVGDRDLDLRLGQEIHGVLAAAVDFRVSFLAAEAFDFRHGHTFDAHVGQGFLHGFEFERLDDGGDEFHGSSWGGSFRGMRGQRKTYCGGITVWMCRSLSCLAVTGVGLWAMRSCAFCVLGKAMTSRMLVVPQSRAHMRSRPKAMPPCGGAP